ncbi:arylsulfatase [Arundinibacter roseus]|uniref:Arylsulfatase n=1 Tax=Arundinibacter roseus TaxID=2070510 RepID=A0A4R4K1Z8_9BACT|nr:arylsulfatase [Arundinibacter roseus]TDB60019.1 arylsulfatase [Arundinibacter roseus]
MKKFAVLFLLTLGYAATAFAQKPNIIVIMVDDMGFSDIGCYGSEISTPHLDKLAQNGALFTQFYNAARCCPSRASLLTGVYPHQAGMGKMVVSNPKDRSTETPYQGWLSKKTATVAEVLKTAGYKTYMSGKWHVGEQQPDWPLQRGFDSYFGLISGASSYYEVLPNRLMLNDNEPYTPPKDFYLTDAISDRAVGYIERGAASKDPFFLYVAYTAPHWPIHAPDEEIAKYRGKYQKGWDVLRQQRYDKQLKLGLLPAASAPLSVRDSTIGTWEEAQNKDEWDLRMAAYAAMVTRMDAGIGKIVEKLKATGQFENTALMFLSDNGACAEVLEGRAKKDLGEPAYTASLTTPAGKKGSYVAYGKEWTALSNTPFRLYKQYTHEGGIATPLIIHYPDLIKKGFKTPQVGHIMDLMPTCLELAGVVAPKTHKELAVKPMEGKSLVPILKGKKRPGHDFIAWEHFDSRAIRQGDWKLVWSRETKKWELYDLSKDRSETNDLAAAFPQKVRELEQNYSQWAQKMGVE